MLRANDVRDIARTTLRSDMAENVSGCGQPYYIVNGKEVFVTRDYHGSFCGGCISFDELENGDIITWFEGHMFNLTHEAGKCARLISKWQEWREMFAW